MRLRRSAPCISKGAECFGTRLNQAFTFIWYGCAIAWYGSAESRVQSIDLPRAARHSRDMSHQSNESSGVQAHSVADIAIRTLMKRAYRAFRLRHGLIAGGIASDHFREALTAYWKEWCEHLIISQASTIENAVKGTSRLT